MEIQFTAKGHNEAEVIEEAHRAAVVFFQGKDYELFFGPALEGDTEELKQGSKRVSTRREFDCFVTASVKNPAEGK